ncbi:hypothetical protein C4K01_3282 [Pseudomonas synxantha]|nr:hypothetical protein C4K01_3282 [Pseudomonas synxantha]
MWFSLLTAAFVTRIFASIERPSYHAYIANQQATNTTISIFRKVY